jgi:hypothetical protein
MRAEASDVNSILYNNSFMLVLENTFLFCINLTSK